MTAFENTKNPIQTAATYPGKTTLYKTQHVPTINGVSVPTLFEKVIRKNHKKSIPQTFRRPSYMRYIEYS